MQRANVMPNAAIFASVLHTYALSPKPEMVLRVYGDMQAGGALASGGGGGAVQETLSQSESPHPWGSVIFGNQALAVFFWFLLQVAIILV